MAQQTSVEWYIETMSNKHIGFKTYANANKEIIEQAKAMEKEQIVNAWDKRVFRGTFVKGWHIETQSGEQYYNETYNK
jgi:hypothetical protein